jgi:precorrin-2/cobalt-factor-2 C20-methyltransferase
MAGTLYGIGVGPGDPELMTLKAKRLIDECPVLAVPVKAEGEKSTAFEIVRPVVDLSKKKVLEVIFSMSKNSSDYWKCGQVAGDQIIEELENGNDVAIVTLGDVSIYSTYMYLEQYVRNKGYNTVIIAGIPSFCSGAALAGIPLTLGNEGLAIVPSAKDNPLVGEAIDRFDNIVIMKAGNSVEKIANMMKRRNVPAECATIIHNVGMEDQYIGPIDTDRKYGYFTTIIIKKGKKDW